MKKRRIVEGFKSMSKVDKVLIVALAGKAITLLGTIFTSIIGYASSKNYEKKYDYLVDEIEANPAVIQRLNEEEEKAINLYADNVITEQEYKNRIKNINSDENKFAVAKEENHPDLTESIKSVDDAKKCLSVALSSLAINGLGATAFTIAEKNIKKKKEQDEEHEFSFKIL